jgi:hypothetical protein
LDVNKLSTDPIVFGDYLKVGADKADRFYEELTNRDKIKVSLRDVSVT